MKKNMNTVNNVLAKKFDYEGNTRGWIDEVPGYADIAAGRKFLSCQRFNLNDIVYFEFWGEHEWEFTITEYDLEVKEIIIYLSLWMRTQHNKASRLPSLMAYCKERLTAAA